METPTYTDVTDVKENLQIAKEIRWEKDRKAEEAFWESKAEFDLSRYEDLLSSNADVELAATEAMHGIAPQVAELIQKIERTKNDTELKMTLATLLVNAAIRELEIMADE